MWIKTIDGWKQLSPRQFDLSGHTPTLLERMGITEKYNGVKAMAEYANGEGRGVYFTYYPDGTFKQTRPAANPIHGME